MKAILMSAALLASLAAWAADETYGTEKKADQAKPEKSTDDAAALKSELSQSQLLDKLHHVSVAHTEMGNLAQTHAMSDKVEKMGEKMAKQFERLDQLVIDYAKDHDIVLSAAGAAFKGKSGEAKAGSKADKMSDLGKLQGEQFDKKFLSVTLSGCEQLIPKLEGAKGKFDDAKFDRVLAKALDTLKGFQRDAERLQKDYAPAT